MGGKIAIVGAGPAGIYAVDALLKQRPDVEIDVFEQTPAPFGLVRYGVAPDHQKIKKVTKVFEKTLDSDRVELWANVSIGDDVTSAQLSSWYDAVLYSTGCGQRRELGIPGEELPGYHGAPQFVAWYNGHPHFTSYRPNLRTRSAAVIGAGNVSMDVARMLLLDYDTVASTDVPGYALEEFRANEVQDVHVFIRRGPEQAAFDLKEIRDITEMSGVTVVCFKADMPASIDTTLPAAEQKKLELLIAHAHDKAPTGGKRMFLHFFRSPAEILGDDGGVREIRVEHTRIVEEGGSKRATSTGETSTFEVGLVVSAAGYRGSPIDGVPFDARSGTIPNDEGRVLGSDGKPIAGLYVAGWIKRGPSGVIGTNKACAVGTVERIVRDLDARPPDGSKPGRSAVAGVLGEAGIRPVSWADWRRLDQLEVGRGAAAGKVREKFLSASDAFAALDA